MFEVIICSVRTGRVERKSFDTSEKAREYISRREAAWAGSPKVSARDFRVEVRHLAPPTPAVIPAAA